MAPLFEPLTAETVRVLQSMTVTPKGIPVSSPGSSQKTSAWKLAALAFFLLSRSCYARRQSVVVLQDGTVGTVMVPKQT